MRNFNIALAIVDNGFVYIGEVTHDAGYYVITRCANVRKSGTERGFGQIAFDGPTKDTVLDHCPPVIVPEGRMCHLMEVSQDKWESVLK